MYKIVYEAHKPLSEQAKDAALAPFDAVLDKALAKNPAERYSSALAMRTALLALATETLPEVLPAHILLAPVLEDPDVTRAAPKARDVPVPAPSSPPSSPSLPLVTGSATTPHAPPTTPLTAATSLAGTSPPSVPAPTGWDVGTLAEIEHELAEHVGAVARVLVRRAARGLTSPAEVRHAVAGAIVDFEAREHFLAKAGGTRTIITATAQAVTDFQSSQVGGEVPNGAPGGAPMRQGDVDKAAAALLSSMGPIARIVAKRCAAKSTTREQFVAHVLEQLTPNVDARRVQADLWRAFG
jgi:serine/threonine-protein kinase